MDADQRSGSRDYPRPRPLALVCISGVWIVVGSLFALQLVALGIASVEDAWWMAFIDWGPWILLSPLVVYWALWHPFGTGRLWRPLGLHVGMCLMLVVGLSVAANSMLAARPPTSLGPPRGGFPHRPPSDVKMSVIRARFVVPIYGVIVLGTNAWCAHRRSVERERRALQAEARLAEARLRALQMQLHPHFLFNALNAVSGLIPEKPEQADAMVCALSDLLRGVLEVSERRLIPLAEEMTFVQRYLEIHRIRFSDRIEVTMEVEQEALRASVPPLLLQPLVENAIVHGILPRPGPGKIHLAARRSSNRLVLTVADDGVGIERSPKREGTGLGLGNVRARLAAVYGDDALLTLKAIDRGTLAVIELPWQEAGA